MRAITRPTGPEEEGAWALPHGEFGLDVIALVGALCFNEHRSIPEIHQHLLVSGVQLAQRTVTHLLHRYEELVTLRLADHTRLRELLTRQGRVILARSLLSSSQGDLVALLREVTAALPVPVDGVISDGQQPIQAAVQTVLPDVPHQLCQFHYLREAAKPLYEADRHAKKELKKHLRGVRPLERALDDREDDEATAIRGYCLAVRSALTDDGQPPLSASGLHLHDRVEAIAASIARVEAAKGGSPSPSPTCSNS